MLRKHDLDDLIDRLEMDGQHRVIRKIAVAEGRTGVPYHGGDTFIAVVLDVETTGLDPAKDVIIELAMRRFRFDVIGRILKIDTAWFWQEDPGRPLDPEVARITGLTEAGLEGQTIDEATAVRLLTSSHLVVAHNAAFDRKFVERRLPSAAGLPWACSMCEVDWEDAGFEGRALGFLAYQAGYFFDAHRATSDVDAVIAMLSHVLPHGRTVLSELVHRSSTPSVRIEAVGADFSVKDELRSRGYRWDADLKVWWKEIRSPDLSEEEAWLGRNVYSVDARAKASGPRITTLSARERYA